MGGWIRRIRAQERVVALSISTAVLMTGQGVVGPVLPVYARRFGVSLAAVGVTVAAFGLARLLLNIPLGSLSDRWGRRFLLVGGPLVVAVSMVGTGLAGGILSLTIWRFVAGAGSSMYMTGALIYLTDISSLSNRGRMIGFNQGALLLGQSIGPGMGGVLAEQFGIRAPFFFIAGAASIACVYGFLRLPETLPSGERNVAGNRVTNRGALSRLLKSPAFLAVAAINFAVFFTRGSTRSTLLPLAGTDLFGLGLGEVGLLLTGMAVVNLVFLPPAAAAADRFGRTQVITPSMVLTAGALVVLAVAGSVVVFTTGALILALATSVAGPAPAALAADTVPAEVRGVSLGVFRTVGDFGLLLGPPLLGFAADVGGFGLAFGLNAAIVGLITVGFFVVSRRIGESGNA
ncbi:MAG TPA: MFS transporter [Acidimicrobiia bacterium]|nr:MFS transporter [Acidimicrobiia bacterium]